MKFYLCKNFFWAFIAIATFGAMAIAGDISVARDSMEDAESYRVEKPVDESEAQRSVAGGNVKEVRNSDASEENDATQTEDGNVEFWDYPN